MERLRFKNSPSFTMNITLSNKPFRFRFDYNFRADTWFMSIMTFDVKPIVSGIKLVLNYNVIDIYKSYDLPVGALVVLADNLDITRLSKESFSNGDASLWFIPDSELEELELSGVVF